MLKSLKKATGAKKHLNVCARVCVWLNLLGCGAEEVIVSCQWCVCVCVCVPHPKPQNTCALNNPQTTCLHYIFKSLLQNESHAHYGHRFDIVSFFPVCSGVTTSYSNEIIITIFTIYYIIIIIMLMSCRCLKMFTNIKPHI